MEEKYEMNIVNESGKKLPLIDWDKVLKIITKTLNKKIEAVNIVFITKEKIRELNKVYRSKDKETNTLSFEDSRDIFIAPEIIEKEANNYNFLYKEWLLRMVVHGILHLEGYIHEKDSDAKEMGNLEDEIIKEINLS